MEEKLEESVINYVKKLSLEEQRSDPNSKFNTIAVTVKTITNNGLVISKLHNISIPNGCFFISIAQSKTLDPFRLMVRSKYENLGNVLDSDKIEDMECIKRVATLVESSIKIYSGKKLNRNVWKIGPDPLMIVLPTVSATNEEIAIVTDNNHFEYIPPEEAKKLVNEPKNMTLELATRLQKDCEISYSKRSVRLRMEVLRQRYYEYKTSQL